MILIGSPLKGKELEKLKTFLKSVDLDYDDGIEYTICILSEDLEIMGTGSVEQNVLKCIAVNPKYQGNGIAAMILSQLVQYEFEKGRPHLFMYTKPKNLELFGDLSFYEILKTDDVLFMENRKYGIRDYIDRIKAESPKAALDDGRKIGAVVANCNPFTLGHRYLIEQAAAGCDYVHVFVLSDKRSEIPAEDRYDLVAAGISDIPNVILHGTSDYLISAATFPTYFMKEKGYARKANCRLDVRLFCERIAPELNIRYRYVGTEPDCNVTREYNETLREILPEYDIVLREIERKKNKQGYISASAVRSLAKAGMTESIKDYVPQTTFEYICKNMQ